MRRLAVFDIDGTLTDTNAVDDECYLRSVADILGLSRQSLDWSEAPHVTDSALLRWLAERHTCPLNATHESDVLHRFLELLAQQFAANPARFHAIAGAPNVHAELESRGWHIALATGGWEPSARFKLKAIGFDTAGIVLASATDALTRIDIVRLALERATEALGAFERVVSVGDATWDVRTAAAVGWPFVGVATGVPADRLRAAGASTIVSDLSDITALCLALEVAEVPHVGDAPHVG
jgi:phosphoglycolate phosphatase-like HAD superfamily hydrolase